MGLPTLTTSRLLLRPFRRSDADAVWRLAGAREIAQYTLHIPHPYERQMAVTWIASHADRFAGGEGVTLAVTLCDDATLVGAMGLSVDAENGTGELGYWIGIPYWGRGYAPEAARALLAYGFGELDLHRIYACHLAPNVASGRVMQKLGMVCEGTLREHVVKWGKRYDLVMYGLLRSEHDGIDGSDTRSATRKHQGGRA
ncbi:MAG: GNAT family N-acetyltransferase [Anaerolineae bacterium]